MNETIRTIKNRRTTRKFNDKPVSKEQLDEILEAGLFAPSAHNQQSWHFTVIQSKDMIEELNHITKKIAITSSDPVLQNAGRNEKFNIFYGAPVVVVVSGDNNAMMPEVDCAAATQNMLLAAESLRVGACWNGMISLLFNSDKKEEYIQKLQIPSGYTPYYAAVFGHRDIAPAAAPERRNGKIQYL